MTKDDYKARYYGKTKEELESMLPALKGNVGKQDYAINALDAVMELIENPEFTPPEAVEHPVMSDLWLAGKYINKADSSAKRKIEFALTFSDYKRLMARKRCYYTGIELVHTNEIDPAKLTLDRIDSSIGYTKENTVACSAVANSVKNAVLEQGSHTLTLTTKQFKKMAAKL